jgi:hypothetical protein
MKYSSRTIVVSQSCISEAEVRSARDRLVDHLDHERPPADQAQAMLLVMQQSLRSMKRFLATPERDLERSLGETEKSRRTKPAARRRTEVGAEEVAQGVVEALQDSGIQAERIALARERDASEVSASLPGHNA